MIDWNKEYVRLAKKQKEVSELIDKLDDPELETNDYILEGLAMLSGHLIEEVWDAMYEADKEIRESEPEKVDDKQTWYYSTAEDPNVGR